MTTNEGTDDLLNSAKASPVVDMNQSQLFLRGDHGFKLVAVVHCRVQDCQLFVERCQEVVDVTFAEVVL